MPFRGPFRGPLARRVMLPKLSKRGNTMRVIAGVTKDSSGAALGGCTVNLFLTSTNQIVATVISDADGNYSFSVASSNPYYAVSYKAGSPDVAGTTLNTLVGV